MFKQKRFQFMLENVRISYFLNCMGQAVPSIRPSMGKTAKLQPSCQWFIMLSPGICSSSNEIRLIRRTTAGMYRVHQNTKMT